MYQDPLVVKVALNEVTLSIRTNDDRVDEHKLAVEEFEQVLLSCHAHGTASHFGVPVTPRFTAWYAVPASNFQVMLAQYNALKGSVR